MLSDETKKLMREMKEAGKTISEIARAIGRSPHTVSFHLTPGVREYYTAWTRNNRKKHPYMSKCALFRRGKFRKTGAHSVFGEKLSSFYKKGGNTFMVNVDQVIEKFSENPVCYLTGEPINISNTTSYHFDHIIPKSLGGDNSLDNLGLCTKEANQTKGDKTPQKLFDLCQKILENNGYKVECIEPNKPYKFK